MNLSKIFLAWIATVVMGSLLLFPLGGIVVMVSGCFSAVCSLPTLIALLIVRYTNEGQDYKTKLQRINLTHVIMFVLTLIVGYIQTESMEYILIVNYYAVIALIFWMLTFRAEWKLERRNR